MIMNRTRSFSRDALLTSILLLASFFAPASAPAQYLFLDTDGDGVHTDADVVSPSGTIHVDVWLDTCHDRDGSLRSCNSHTGAPHEWRGDPPDPGLNIFSYDLFLKVTEGTITWGTFQDQMGFQQISQDDDIQPTMFHASRFADLGDERPPGRYKLASFTATVQYGTPSIHVSEMES